MTDLDQNEPGCYNHRAATAANRNQDHLDCTGVGTCACARHGCAVPSSMVDFQKGERYSNYIFIRRPDLTFVGCVDT